MIPIPALLKSYFIIIFPASGKPQAHEKVPAFLLQSVGIGIGIGIGL
jgi:hypothetical protein